MPTETVIGASFTTRDMPRDHRALATAVLRFYEESGLRPELVDFNRWSNARTFDPELLARSLADETLQQAWLWFENVPEFTFYLRPESPNDQEFETRWVAMISSRLPLALTAPLRRFLSDLVDIYPVSNGAIAGYRSLTHAGRECFSGAFSGVDLDPDTRVRLKEDAMRRHMFRDKLRRLYPVTIIGPEIWRQLPPLPSVDPAPKVEDLGNCKMLTVWPELVEPHDPAFLAGTVELRRWLWPYTIQNPADAVGLAIPGE